LKVHRLMLGREFSESPSAAVVYGMHNGCAFRRKYKKESILSVWTY